MEFLFVATTGSTGKAAVTDTFLTPSATAFLSTVSKTEPSAWISSFEAFAVNGVEGTALAVSFITCLLITIQGLLHNHETRKDNMKSHIRETLRE